jgi:hypothetical protein
MFHRLYCEVRIKMKPASICLAGLLALAGAAPALAHHSAAMFDRNKEITLVGALKEIQWTNPHGWIQLLVPGPNGAAVEWSIEAANPAGMVRMGLKRTPPYPAPGDKITVVMHPLRDGRPGGSFITMTLADGKSFGVGGGHDAVAPITQLR